MSCSLAVRGHAEDLVVVALAHDALATFTIAGRSSRSPSGSPAQFLDDLALARAGTTPRRTTAWCRCGSKSAPTASMA
jgi:hypothetical protein